MYSRLRTGAGEQVLESEGRVRIREEPDRVEVLLGRVAAQNLGKVSALGGLKGARYECVRW
jgi:hypothetical protein